MSCLDWAPESSRCVVQLQAGLKHANEKLWEHACLIGGLWASAHAFVVLRTKCAPCVEVIADDLLLAAVLQGKQGKIAAMRVS